MPLRRIRESLNMVERIDYHVRVRNTGTPEAFAQTLGISRSSWFEYLQVLTHDLAFPIQYNAKDLTYEYTCEGRFVCKFMQK